MKVTFEEAVECLENGYEITLECDGYDYEISQSEDWLGGEDTNGYISLVLGNVVYESAERVLKESIDFLSKDGKEVTINF